MVHCDVMIVEPGDVRKGVKGVFVTLPRVGEETVVAVDGDAWSCRVDMVRHIGENALGTSPQASVTIFVSRI